MAKDLQRKLAKVTDSSSKDVADLHEIMQKQEDKLTEQDQQRKDLNTELNHCLAKQIELSEQLIARQLRRNACSKSLKLCLSVLNLINVINSTRFPQTVYQVLVYDDDCPQQ